MRKNILVMSVTQWRLIMRDLIRMVSSMHLLATVYTISKFTFNLIYVGESRLDGLKQSSAGRTERVSSHLNSSDSSNNDIGTYLIASLSSSVVLVN